MLNRVVCPALLLASLGACGDEKRPESRAPRAAAAAPAPTAAPVAAAAAIPAAAPLPPDDGKHEGGHRWSRRLGGVMADAGRSVAVGRAGQVAIAGYVRGEVDAGPGQPLAASDGADAVVATYDAAGTLAWARTFGGKGDDSADAIAIDGDGNVIVGGAFSYELAMADGGKLTSKGGDDAFLVKLAPDGRRLWAKRLGGVDVDAVYGIATDAAGDIYVTGELGQSAEIGGQVLTSAGGSDAFILKLGADGSIRWSRRFGAGGADYGRAVRSSGDGVVVLAEVSRDVDLGGGVLPAAGNRDIAVLALDGAGNHRWSRRFGGVNDELALGLALDPAGAVVITGSFDGTLELGAERYVSAGLADAYVAKLSPAGEPLWFRQLGGKEADIGGGVATDRHGNIIAVGWFWYEIASGPQRLKSAGRKDAYAVALSPDGAPLWARRYGSTENDFLQAVATFSSGEPVAVGTFHRTVDFGGGDLTALADPRANLPLGDIAVVALTR